MTSLSTASIIVIGALLLALVLFLAMRGRKKTRLGPDDPKTWDNRAVQKFFAEVAADEKIFGIEHKDPAAVRARKAEQLREIETLLNSSAYLSLTEEQQEMQVRLLADESVVRLMDDANIRSQENDRLILELRARRQREAEAFLAAQKERDTDIARLRDMERRSSALGNGDKALLADIESLKRKMVMSRYLASRPKNS
jgi:hypothetical protein